jgi:hypothetical protein
MGNFGDFDIGMDNKKKISDTELGRKLAVPKLELGNGNKN